MSSKGTMPRPIRVPTELWEKALTKARGEGTTLSAVVVDFLRRYVAQ